MSEEGDGDELSVEAIEVAAPAARKGKRKSGPKPGQKAKKNKAGKFEKDTNPTEQQIIFADALQSQLRTGLMLVRAAKAADYSGPATSGYAALKSPRVRALIRAGQDRELDKATSVAVRVATLVAIGRERCDPTRWAVIQFLLKRAGLDAPPAKKTHDDKPLSAMTLAEMEEVAARFDAAKTVATVPELPASSVQVIDNKQ